MTSPSSENHPSPVLFFETVTAYQRSFVIKAAVDLDLFTRIGEGAATAAEIAAAIGASERGTRILCDYLTALGFLTKTEGRYALTPDSAVFLDRRSPAYMGGVTGFLLAPDLLRTFGDVATAVRTGTTAAGGEGTVAAENPLWVEFARGMGTLARPAAEFMAETAALDPSRKVRILDIAAGHGVFGLAFLQRYPNAEVVAVDWNAVLGVARENVEAAGVADRWTALPGSAFEVEYGEGYDLVLLTNFLHHFDAPTNTELLRKVRASLADGGRAMTLEFVPNEDRVSPPNAATFSMVMLTSTPAGDAYTFSELASMLADAGFSHSEPHVVPPGLQTLVVSEK